MITQPSTPTTNTYRRGQVEWALWRMSTIGRPAPAEPSPVFRNRIKRLLEIDRNLPVFFEPQHRNTRYT